MLVTKRSCSTEKVISFLFFCEIWNGRPEITSVFLFVQHHLEQTRVVTDRLHIPNPTDATPRDMGQPLSKHVWRVQSETELKS